MTPHPLKSLDDIRYSIATKSLSRAEAENLAHHATRKILRCEVGARLCDSLLATLAEIPIADRLGPEVGAAIREQAVRIVDEIEEASAANDDDQSYAA